MKSGNLNFLEPSGPLQACKGTTLPLLKFHENLLPPLVAAVFFQADGQTGTTKPIIAFRKFMNAPENPSFGQLCLCRSHDSQSQGHLQP